MPTSDLLVNGLELMLLGMGIVFTFLIVLVFALNLMSKISSYFDTVEETQISEPPPAQTQKKPDNTALIAVISAAISRYRSAHNQH